MDRNMFERDQVNLNETLRNFVNLSESLWGAHNLLFAVTNFPGAHIVGSSKASASCLSLFGSAVALT